MSLSFFNRKYLGAVLLLFFLAACQPQTEPVTPPSSSGAAHTQPALDIPIQNDSRESEITATPESTPTVVETTPVPATPTIVFTPTATATIPVTPTVDTRLLPNDWRNWPIIPTLSENAYRIYERGLAAGNDPGRFSVIGDCQSVPEVFLGVYETDWYWLGEEYQYLQETIDAYPGSFSHESLAVKGGMSTSTALSPLWADQEKCGNTESPVQCELRDYQPSIVFINLGTNWRADASTVPYEEYLRQIVAIVIEHGTLPILLSKADNIEGDYSINLITAKVAYDNDVPLVNFWLAAQFLKNNGLDESTDNIYLTPTGWDRRNFIALEALDAVRRQIEVFGGGE
jgi:hypothetical protein